MSVLDVALEFNADDFADDNDFLDVDGRFHALCKGATFDDRGTNDCIKVTFLTLAGTNPAGIGKILIERIYLSDRAMPRARKLAVKLGLVSVKAPTGAGTVSAKPDWKAMIGREYVIDAVKNTYDKDDGTQGTNIKCSYLGIFRPDDDRVRDVPRGRRDNGVGAVAVDVSDI
jgi:hypothetical protein